MYFSAPSFFLNKLVNFLGVGFSLYLIAALSQRFSEDPMIKHTVKCKYCRKRISERVSPASALSSLFFLGWLGN